MDVKLISDLRNTPIPPGFVDRVVKSPPNAPNAPPIAVTLAEPNGKSKGILFVLSRNEEGEEE